MKRLFLALSLCAGMLVAGMANASAALVCHDDPTVGIGLPLTTNLNSQATILNNSVQVTASTTHKSTSFAAGFSLL